MISVVAMMKEFLFTTFGVLGVFVVIAVMCLFLIWIWDVFGNLKQHLTNSSKYSFKKYLLDPENIIISKGGQVLSEPKNMTGLEQIEQCEKAIKEINQRLPLNEIYEKRRVNGMANARGQKCKSV